jgi:hypothetical protein
MRGDIMKEGKASASMSSSSAKSPACMPPPTITKSEKLMQIGDATERSLGI